MTIVCQEDQGKPGRFWRAFQKDGDEVVVLSGRSCSGRTETVVGRRQGSK